MGRWLRTIHVCVSHLLTRDGSRHPRIMVPKAGWSACGETYREMVDGQWASHLAETARLEKTQTCKAEQ